MLDISQEREDQLKAQIVTVLKGFKQALYMRDLVKETALSEDVLGGLLRRLVAEGAIQHNTTTYLEMWWYPRDPR